jgi:hypothetical protein
VLGVLAGARGTAVNATVRRPDAPPASEHLGAGLVRVGSRGISLRFGQGIGPAAAS